MQKMMKLVVLAAGMLASAMLSFGATETVDGITWTYAIWNGEATVGGNNGTTAVPTSTTGAITIPSRLGGKSVTRIGAYAFRGCSGLTSVTIPNGVTSIGVSAFINCSGLKSVMMPNWVDSIGSQAFYGCSGLTNVTIPHGVDSIGYQVFFGCSGLASVTMPDMVNSIGYAAFGRCSGLTSVTIGNGVRSIKESAFSDCSGLMSVTIPSGVTSIDAGAFSGCGRLNSIIVMAGNPSFRTVSGLLLTKNGKELVAGINGDVAIPDCVTTIGSYAFSGYNGLTSVTIPGSVTSIGEGAFSGCIGLTSVTIPDSVTGIREYAFKGCSGLTSVTIPDSVTSIGYSAFEDCSRLTSMMIPGSVTYIEDGVFADCTGLTSVTIGDGVTTIRESAFYGCSGLESVSIPNSVKWILRSAFADCYKLYDTTTIPGVKLVDGWAVGNDGSLSGHLDLIGVRGIAEGSFSGCDGLTSVTIGDGVTSIGYEAFSCCGALTSVRIPDSVERISYGAFSDCEDLFDTTTIPGVKLVDGWAVGPAEDLGQELDLTGARGVADSAFECVGGLTNVIIPGTVKSIGQSAFSWAINGGEDQVVSVTISEGVERIGDWAFSGCGMRSVTIPSSVTYVGEAAFGECFYLTAIDVGVDNANYSSKNGLLLSKDGKTLIHGVTGNVTIPDGVENIGYEAFSAFPDMWVTVPSSVTNIQAEAFSSEGTTVIQFLGDAPMVDPEAFSYCSCYILVRYGSAGWDVPIPGDWKGFEINYYDAFVFDPNDDCNDWSNYGLPTYTHVNGNGRLGRGLFCFRYCVVDREDNHIGLGSSIQVEYRIGDELEAVGADVYIGAIRGSESGKGWQTASIPFRGIPGNGEVIDLINVFFADREDARLVMTDVVWKWLDDPVTVRFEACGGKLPKGVEEIAVYDEKYEMLPMPTREGCEFIEWSEKPYLSCEIGSEVYEGRGLPASSNVTIYALWKVPWKTALDPDGVFQGDGNGIELGSELCVVGEWEGSTCEFELYGAYAWASPLMRESKGVDGSPSQEYVGDCVKYRVGDDEGVEYDLIRVSVRGRGTLNVPMSCDGVVRVYVDGKETSFPEVASKGFEVNLQEDQDHVVLVRVRGTLRKSWGEYDDEYDEEYYGCSGHVGALRWNEVQPCTVTFNANGGACVPVSQLVEAGVEISSLQMPIAVRNGYMLIGWFTEADGGSMIDASGVIDRDVTFYAHWLSNSDIFIGTAESYETSADGAFTLKLGELVLSVSTPRITVKGLPTGLKFDAKMGLISGKATKPGVYVVTVSATNATVKKPVTATFELVVPNLASDVLPGLKPETGAYGVVMCGVAFDPWLVDCAPKSGWSVKVSGLPAGLKYDAGTGRITGVPTKAGIYTVTFTATMGGEKQTATITLNVEALPTWATGAFAGSIAGTGNGEWGTASMTVAANGKISGKIALGGTNWTFKADSFSRAEEDSSSEVGSPKSFVVNAVAKAGKATMPVVLEVRCAENALELSNGVAVGEIDGCEVTLWRNMWKDKATAVTAKAELAKWEGLYTLSLEDGGYLSLTVGKDGSVKASGKLSDGTKISATSPLVYDEEYGWLAYFYTAPSAYKGGSFAIAVGFDGPHGASGGLIEAALPVGPARWTSRNPQATGVYGEGFSRTLDFFGAYYGKKPDVSAWSMAEFNAESPDGYTFGGVTPKVSVAQATGIFKGSCSFLPDGGGKAKKANFEGIVVLGAATQSGFYLWDAVGSYIDPKTGKEKTYKYKESYWVELR